MTKLVFISFLLLNSSVILAQEKDSSQTNFGIKFNGYVKTDIMYDSRQTVAAREGHYLLYPTEELLDVNSEDINAKDNLNILAIQTRLVSKITAPDVLGAKVGGLIEAAFFGQTESDINGFRLRHAFLKMEWEKSSILIGQYWHPMFVTEVHPTTISSNAGLPIQAVSRNPQVKYTYHAGDVHLSLTALSQLDFMNFGPDGTSTSYLRNSTVPIVDFTIKYKSNNIVVGAGANYKKLHPSLQNTDGTNIYLADAEISSTAFIGFAKFVKNRFSWKVEGIYGGNLTDLVMLGGYAVKDTTSLGFESGYTDIKTVSAWTELAYGNDVQVALFAGYTENLGADDNIVGDIYYSRGSDIAYVMRFSPRIQYKIGRALYGVEVEYTVAEYGTPDIKGVVRNGEAVGNLRVLLAGYLYF